MTSQFLDELIAADHAWSIRKISERYKEIVALLHNKNWEFPQAVWEWAENHVSFQRLRQKKIDRWLLDRETEEACNCYLLCAEAKDKRSPDDDKYFESLLTGCLLARKKKI